MKAKKFGFILYWAALFGLMGYKSFDTFKHKITLREHNPLTEQEMNKDSLFSKLNFGLKEALYQKDAKIYILSEKDFPKEIAHVHGGRKTMCLPRGFSYEALVHESAHMRHCFLNEKKSDFEKKWKKISDYQYQNKEISNPLEVLGWFYLGLEIKEENWEGPFLYPKEGLLNPYSSKSVKEDVAEFVSTLSYEYDSKDLEELCLPKGWDRDSLIAERHKDKDFSFFYVGENSSFPFYFANPNDKRYQQKLDLLKEYEFITKEQHKILSERLGSLYYLIKSEDKFK